LENARTVCARAEDAGHDPALREQYDVVVARAVSNLSVLVELCLPLAKVGGVFVAAKGEDAGPEMAAAGRASRLLGGGAFVAHAVATLGPSGLPFQAILVQKHAPTPPQYPRSAGTPKLSPL